MTPQEKAKQLIHDFIELNGNSFFAISNSLKCVDEILIALEKYPWENINLIEYYTEVKKELENFKNI